ncbi:MAG: NUDIX hydrolase [Candidatus Levyibacteriota bacterium]
MIFTLKPANFKNRFDIVSCFCMKEDALLLLHRQNHKPQGNTWGIPAGKVDGEERLDNAIQRELKEETGLDISTKGIQLY